MPNSFMHNRILLSKQTLHIYTPKYRRKCLRNIYISFKMNIYISVEDLSIYKWQEICFRYYFQGVPSSH